MACDPVAWAPGGLRPSGLGPGGQCPVVHDVEVAWSAASWGDILSAAVPRRRRESMPRSSTI